MFLISKLKDVYIQLLQQSLRRSSQIYNLPNY